MAGGSPPRARLPPPVPLGGARIESDPTPPALDRLVAELQAGDFYVDGAVAREELRTRRQFNAISTASAFEVDLIVRKDRP